MRYWPSRVDEKRHEDPSLGVAHGRFWKYHPERAWAWELRLQDEIGPDFRIEEAPYSGDGDHVAHRTAFLEEHTEAALAAVEKEVLRRHQKQKQPQPELRLLKTGLWIRNPELFWQLELRLTEKQQIEFRLLALDEPEARADFEREHPDLVRQRQVLIASLTPPEDLLTGMDTNIRTTEKTDEHGNVRRETAA